MEYIQQPSSQEKLQDIYRNSAESVRGNSYDYETALKVFDEYIKFVHHSEPRKGSLLDVGCGSGWSSYLFTKLGYLTTGIDLNAKAFEPPNLPGLILLEGSVMNLPFSDESFDIVTSYQMLEHVPVPNKALQEMLRVLKPGGVFCLVGPNCLGLSISLKTIGIYVWKNRPIKTIFIRVPGMPKHPHGNTLPEAFTVLLLNLFRTFRKSLSNQVTFTMREPDLIPPFNGDNDACYLCNPIDLIKFLSAENFSIMQNGRYGRLPFTALLAGGTWIAARKPSQAQP
jgi:SAM-dependent methyltransferase